MKWKEGTGSVQEYENTNRKEMCTYNYRGCESYIGCTCLTSSTCLRSWLIFVESYCDLRDVAEETEGKTPTQQHISCHE